MPKITLQNVGEIRFNTGLNICEVLDVTEHKVHVACNGTGSCGLCKIKIMKGRVSAPTPTEQFHLSEKELAAHVRLGCQIKPENDLIIAVVNHAPKSIWRNLRVWDEACLGRIPRPVEMDVSSEGVGVAIDLGTTSITAAMFRLSDGDFLSGQYCANPQSRFGSDVVTRIMTATENPANAERMQNLVVTEIEKVLNKLCLLNGVVKKDIERIYLVGNTPMLALLSGKNYELLLQPEHWLKEIDCIPENVSEWKANWQLPASSVIEVVEPIAGYIGSDLLVGLNLAQLMMPQKRGLIIDFGTNSEIGLWTEDRLLVTSAAGGPAFEGVGIRKGMQAQPGAIYKMDFIEGKMSTQTIKGDRPVGICGSGLVDLITLLLEKEEINEVGTFVHRPHGRFEYLTEDSSFFIEKKDVDAFQRAKAAIGVGICVLLDKANITMDQLDSIYIGGAFGQFINIEHAQKIGLLPPVAPEVFKVCGNTAVLGCKYTMLADEFRKNIKAIRKKVEIVNLGTEPEFDRYYLEHLFLNPIEEFE